MATYDQRISSGINDGCWQPGYNYWEVTDTWLYLGSGYIGFFRFLNVNVSQGATINSAYIKIKTQDNLYPLPDPVYLKVRAVDEDNTASFPSSDGTNTDPGNRPRTTAGVDWDITSIAWNTVYTSPNIKSVIQEVIDRPGWASGNAIAIAIENDGGDDSTDFMPYEESSVYAAELIIDYTGTTTNTKTVESQALIYKDSINYGLRITKPTYEVLTETDPSHYIFNSSYGTLKYYISGSVSIVIEVSEGDDHGSITYNHALGYIPYVEAYVETYDGSGIWEYLPSYGFGATVEWRVTYIVDNNDIYFYANELGATDDMTFNIKFFVFKNKMEF